MSDIEDGDMLISTLQRRLWALTFECLSKFECPVMFDFTKRSIPNSTEQTIVFFVPRRHQRMQEIKQYLFDELAAEQSTGSDIAGTWIPGASVHVLEFSGIDFYMTAAEVDKMLIDLKASFATRSRPH